MTYFKKLGVFVKVPVPGRVKTRLVPPLSDEEACELYTAFLADLFARLAKLKKIAGTVFYAGGDPEIIRGAVPPRFTLEPQRGETLGERLEDAFRVLLAGERQAALVIGSDSPDIPLVFIKRAFLKLKHKDVVIGPAADGGYYLIGLKRLAKPLFNGIAWGTEGVLKETLEKIRKHSLSCSLLPLWYDVDNVKNLSLLESMVLAKKIERGDRLHNIERVLRRLRAK